MKLGKEKCLMLVTCEFLVDAYVHVSKDERRKLDPKAKKFMILGYGEETKGY